MITNELAAETGLMALTAEFDGGIAVDEYCYQFSDYILPYSELYDICLN